MKSTMSDKELLQLLERAPKTQIEKDGLLDFIRDLDSVGKCDGCERLFLRDELTLEIPFDYFCKDCVDK